jgi:PAS domain S-box-containing protein
MHDEHISGLLDRIGRLLDTFETHGDAALARYLEDIRGLLSYADLLHAICETMPDAVYVKNPEGKYLMMNTVGASMVGKSPAEIIGQDDTAILPPETARRIMATDRRILDHGETLTYEETVTLDAFSRTFLSSKMPYRDANGRIIGLIGISRDITAQKEAMDALLQSHAQLQAGLQEAQAAGKQFRDLVEAAPDAIVGVDREGHIVLVNSQTERLFGYTRSELMGHRVEMLLPEPLRAGHRTHRSHYTRAPHTRPMGVGLDLVARKKDGQIFPVEVSLSPLDTVDGLIITSIIRDVTERKSLERKLRQYTEELELLVDERTTELRAERDLSKQVIEHTTSLIMVLSAEGSILLFNQGCEEVSGYAQDETMGRSWTMLLPDHARERGTQLFDEILSGDPVSAWESPLRTKEDEIRTVLWHVGVVRSQDQGISSVVMIGRDITEERRLQEQVLQSERLATVGRMAAQVAHEIRNPLSSIGLNIELLADEIRDHRWNDSGEAKELIKITLSEIERLNGVIGDYLKFARMPAKQLQEESVNDLIQDLVHLVRPEVEGANVVLAVQLAGGLPAIRVDRILISQALLNCVRNALEAMPEGGVLTVTTRRIDEEVGVSISDTGMGIEPEHLDQVFEPFYSTKDYGTGLGLPYVLQIMQEHNGALSLDSRPGTGTTITLRFPVSY